MAKLNVTGIVVDGDDGQYFSMMQVDSADTAVMIRERIVEQFRDMGVHADRVMVRVQDRNVMLFERVGSQVEFFIDGVHQTTWHKTSDFYKYVAGCKFGFMKNGKVYECGSEIETLIELSSSGFTIGLISDGFYEMKIRESHSYEMVAQI